MRHRLIILLRGRRLTHFYVLKFFFDSGGRQDGHISRLGCSVRRL